MVRLQDFDRGCLSVEHQFFVTVATGKYFYSNLMSYYGAIAELIIAVRKLKLKSIAHH
jgi:hypothetical protein